MREKFIVFIQYNLISNNRYGFENCNLKSSLSPKYAVVIANPQNAD